jgi:hypothetical protein
MKLVIYAHSVAVHFLLIKPTKGGQYAVTVGGYFPSVFTSLKEGKQKIFTVMKKTW